MKIVDERWLKIELDGVLGNIIRQNISLELSEQLLEELQELVNALKNWYEEDKKNRQVEITYKAWRGFEDIVDRKPVTISTEDILAGFREIDAKRGLKDKDPYNED